MPKPAREFIPAEEEPEPRDQAEFILVSNATHPADSCTRRGIARTHRSYAAAGQIRIPSHGRDPRRPISSQIESRQPIFPALELPLWWRAAKVPLQLSVGR